jgi:hypothetical protein
MYHNAGVDPGGGGGTCLGLPRTCRDASGPEFVIERVHLERRTFLPSFNGR